MALIFHQNMRRYGGGSVVRNAVFNARFNAIGVATGHTYIVAGFTEVMNSGPALRASLRTAAQQLDPGLTDLYVFRVGTTSVGGLREFIGIAVDPGWVNVVHLGTVLRDANNRWQLYSAAVGVVALTNNVWGWPPAGFPLQADSRGVAFIAATAFGANYIFGFMHNMYAIGEKSGAFNNLGRIGDTIRRGLAGFGYAGARIVIGGDFNLSPRQPTQRPIATRSVWGVDGFGNPINTTAVNLYDFWVVTDPGTVNGDCDVRNETLVANGSDHRGVVLTV
jgi:hypothetical protein